METKPRIYSISEAARELSLSAEWLRQGEKRGSLPLAKRDRNGHRYYTSEGRAEEDFRLNVAALDKLTGYLSREDLIEYPCFFPKNVTSLFDGIRSR